VNKKGLKELEEGDWGLTFGNGGTMTKWNKLGE
jgi:hypothetical protein